MGSSTTTSQQQYQPTATEQQLMANELQLSNAALPGQLSNLGMAQQLQSNLMTGSPLPGYLSMLTGGGISPQQSQNMAQLGNQGVATQFQQIGGLDSGSAAQAMAGNYANILNTNQQFDINSLLQQLNLASGNAAQNIGMMSANNQMLGSQSGALAGSTGSSTVFANPFQTAFQGISSLGSAAMGAYGLSRIGK